ncbi:single-stranded DNA-binding protein [Geodermatophilus sp. YIM 151500]|uniref:single-stranded DNA-binding protein n=1 Tax=Geodermatophilus sp. YIM 151500 TaxID=2984531 RepID=UPI0021E4DB85|nr:single-stranded DNA-binding protein [Geodermatophilus sp. YIM 151500]MCV2490910.1 single-stranded DNA-binding protein [Geodermatophilus sp. YIM 151500]
MNDTVITVVGNVVDSPRRVRFDRGAVTNFRMASTARRYDAGSEQFIDSGTFWIDVECWNRLGGHVSASLSKGDPVIVHGTITTHSWETDSGRRNTPRIRAIAVGPDLSRSTAEVQRVRPARPAGASTEEVADAVRAVEDHPPADAPEGAGLPDDVAELVRGRDYETDPGTLQSVETDDLPAQPAYA